MSLVKRGANKKRRFPVFKESPMDAEMVEVLKALMSEEIEDEKQLTEWIEKQKLGEKEANALKGAMRILNGFRENSAIQKIMGAIAKMVGPQKAENPNPFADPDKPKKAKKSEDGDPDDDSKKGADVKIPEAVQKQLDAADARAEKIEKANKDLRDEVKVEKRKREKTELVAKCEKQFSHVPGLSIDEMADMLLDAGEEGRKQIEKQWSATEEAIVKSGLLRTAGTGGGGHDAGSSEQKLEDIAKGLVEKSADGMTIEVARVKAMEQNPELYDEYLDENPAQSGQKG